MWLSAVWRNFVDRPVSQHHVMGISQSLSFGLTFLDYKTEGVRLLSPLSETSFSAGSALFVPAPGASVWGP